MTETFVLHRIPVYPWHIARFVSYEVGTRLCRTLQYLLSNRLNLTRIDQGLVLQQTNQLNIRPLLPSTLRELKYKTRQSFTPRSLLKNVSILKATRLLLSYVLMLKILE